MEKYLILNADDFGMCHAANLATMDLLKKGGITSATIMMPCSWSGEAAAFAARNPQFSIGIHLTLTSEWEHYRWSPVGHDHTESLRDRDGYMWHKSDEFEEHCDLDEVRAEILAQVNKAKALGFSAPSHLDNHMGSLYGIETGRPELLNLTLDLCSELHMPFRLPTSYIPAQKALFEGSAFTEDMVKMLLGNVRDYARQKQVPVLDYLLPHDWNGPQAQSYEAFRDYMLTRFETFPEGISETFIHPSFECDELRGITRSWQRRVWEHRLFADPATRQHIESCGIQLINYRELAEMRLGAH